MQVLLLDQGSVNVSVEGVAQGRMVRVRPTAASGFDLVATAMAGVLR